MRIARLGDLPTDYVPAAIGPSRGLATANPCLRDGFGKRATESQTQRSILREARRARFFLFMANLRMNRSPMSLQEAKRRKRQSEKDRAIEQARRDVHLHDEAVLRPRVVASRAKPSSDGIVGLGHNRGPPLDDQHLTADDLKVLSFKEWCRLCGFSKPQATSLGAFECWPLTQLKTSE